MYCCPRPRALLLQQAHKQQEKEERLDKSVKKLTRQWHIINFSLKGCRPRTSALNTLVLTFWRWTWPSLELKQRNLPGRRAEPAELQRERASSQEEQIASALHHHIGDWPERGLCLPKGRLEWHGLVALGGMWSSLTGTRVAWEAGRVFFFPFPSLQRSLSSPSQVIQLWGQ